MNLYSISNTDSPDEESWFVCIWAGDEATALMVANSHYEYPNELVEEPDLLKVVDMHTQEGKLKPEHKVPHRENRNHVLRLAGFSYADEIKCRSCNLAAMDCDYATVCEDCEICLECQPTEENYNLCDECKEHKLFTVVNQRRHALIIQDVRTLAEENELEELQKEVMAYVDKKNPPLKFAHKEELEKLEEELRGETS